MTITAAKVRELRDRTGAGMMDCKKALESAAGDLEAAVDHLRKAGLKSAAKKAERETAEGRVLVVQNESGRSGHLLAIACETDFLAKGDGFLAICTELEEIIQGNDPDGLEDGERPLMKQVRPNGNGTTADLLTEAVGQMGENIRIVEFARFENPEGAVGAYVHHDYKQAAMVSVTTSSDPTEAAPKLRELCQHIVVFSPEAANRDEVDAAAIERERQVILEGGDLAKKPAEIQEKIISGRMEKFFAGIVLTEQPWMRDDKITVQKWLDTEVGGEAALVRFSHVKIG